jgi:hypothetical protein
VSVYTRSAAEICNFLNMQEDGGVYSCIADNGVGSPAEALVNLQVLCEYMYSFNAMKKLRQDT